jgi:hypothetical protein
MEYSKVQHSFARTATFKGADPASRGVWLSLHVYCGDQENGGTIRSCRTWTDRQWYAAIDATKPELEAAIAQGMARWEGDDLQLNSYDTIGEDAYKVTRDLNRAKANARWAKYRGETPAPRETVPGAMPAASTSRAGGSTDGNAGADAAAVPRAMPIPDHSRPDHSIPSPADAGSGVEGESVPPPPKQPTKAENTAALTKLLHRLVCVTGEVATPKWAGVAIQGRACNLAEALECIEWLVKKARADGRLVEYAGDVMHLLPAWEEHRREKRRQAQPAEVVAP